MSDRRLREFERTAAAGDHEAGAHLFIGRLRTGTLTEDSLRLAAYLQDEGARLAVETLGLRLPYEYEDTPRWLGILAEEWPSEPTIRAAVALARRALTRWERFPFDRWNRRFPPEWRYREAVAMGEAWVVSGGDSFPRPPWMRRLTDGRRVINDASEAIGALGRVVRLSRSSEWNEAEPGRAQYVLTSAAQTFVREDEEEDCALGVAVRKELLPWALGSADPLLERVEASRCAAP